ncbi:hypothetical protein DC3_19520 [Deinococcus cellulosilyticus NBRC 106333 = KACC 11606]|uniref:Peptidase C39-like domain-containing protein n=1 Tax=Deinococcus cellulosilyticus (strain DSM 18568 / NBRC 106333 / KACC 11606 / 5516J-15) TaxID=1223518 RepID=A0A511N1F6_DEIC1|nr:hypothetical protein DC3_19520 [Deinococcus cellulosilyticus NBRC 106333 = KACC 11606]
MTGIQHEYQGYNNCGPTTLGMYLSYWGSPLRQQNIAPILKPNTQDKNVSPQQIVKYVQSKGFKVHHGLAGNSGTLKQLLAARIPVMVETWMEDPTEGGMGHYRLLVGYNDKAGHFLAHDSYLGPNLKLPYRQFDQRWQVFNRTFLVVYPRSQAKKIETLLSWRTSSIRTRKHALKVALTETRSTPGNPYAWFNLGSTLTRLNSPISALKAFRKAEKLGLPERMLWYQFEPFQAYSQQKQPQKVLQLARQVLRKAPDHEEALYWRGQAHLQLNQKSAAKQSFRQALKFRPTFGRAQEALKGTEG